MKTWLAIKTWIATLIAYPLSMFFLVLSIPDHVRFIERKDVIERILLRCAHCRIHVDEPHFCEKHEPMVIADGRKDFDIAAWQCISPNPPKG